LLDPAVAGYNLPMKVQFFDDPTRGPVRKEDVRFNRLGLYMYDDGQRVAIGFDVTPFRERPNIEVSLRNEEGKEAASLNVIEAIKSNFNLTMHIRDNSASSQYEVEAILYYTSHNTGDRMVVDRVIKPLDVSQVGEQ
jgi:hypothetical protein